MEVFYYDIIVSNLKELTAVLDYLLKVGIANETNKYDIYANRLKVYGKCHMYVYKSQINLYYHLSANFYISEYDLPFGTIYPKDLKRRLISLLS